MNHRNTLSVTCPCCRVSIELTAENIRQQDFKRKFGKWDSVTRNNVVKALEDRPDLESESDLFEESE